MGFWIYMTLTVLLVPAILIGVGIGFRKSPPREINWILGYRSRRSMKNEETWKFANACSARLMLRFGWLTLAISLAVMLLTVLCSEEVIATVSMTLLFCQLIPVVAVIPLTERKLKRKFDENGEPK